MEFIEIEGLQVQFLRKHVKNINLRIQQTGHIQVSVPYKIPIDTVYQFLHEKKRWIDTHRLRMQNKQHNTSLNYTTGEKILFLGEPYHLHLHEGFYKQYVELEQNALHIFVRTEATIEQKYKLITQWFRTQMQQHMPELIQKWESIIGVSASMYCIKSMRSRWGYCHIQKKKICLNLKLIEKPVLCLEYVLVHELVHLLEPSHNRRFYFLMGQYLPQWKQIKTLLENF